MFLTNLEVSRGRSWDKDHGKLRGKIEFEDAKGVKFEIPLDESLSKQVVELCSEALVRSAKSAAENMVAEIIAESSHMIKDSSQETSK